MDNIDKPGETTRLKFLRHTHSLFAFVISISVYKLENQKIWCVTDTPNSYQYLHEFEVN